MGTNSESTPKDELARRRELLALLEEAKQAGTWTALLELKEQNSDSSLIQSDLDAARRTFLDRVLSNFGTQPKSSGVTDMVRRLVEYCATHGSRVEVRFRWRDVRVPGLEAFLRMNSNYTDQAMQLRQHLNGESMLAREQRLGRHLQARLQESFPRDLLRFHIGERIDRSKQSGRSLPNVDVPTLFVDHRTGVMGVNYGPREKRPFSSMYTKFLSSFRLPAQSANWNHRWVTARVPTPELIAKEPRIEALYETLAAEIDEEFAEQFLAWFLEPPASSAPPELDDAKAPKTVDQAPESGPVYLDPSHEDSFRRFHGVRVRCGPGDDKCLPMPYNGDPKLIVGTVLKSAYQPNGRRTPVKGYQAAPGDNLCSHDGECLYAGGARCVRWDANVGSRVLPRAHGALLEAYCGCLQKQCQWFTQPRPTMNVDVKSVKLDGWPKRLAVDQSELDLVMDFVFKQEVSRCFVDHLKQLPWRVVLSVEQRRDSTQQTGSISGVPGKVARCIQQMFPSVSVPLRDVTDAELEQGIKLQATIEISVRTVP